MAQSDYPRRKFIKATALAGTGILIQPKFSNLFGKVKSSSSGARRYWFLYGK